MNIENIPCTLVSSTFAPIHAVVLIRLYNTFRDSLLAISVIIHCIMQSLLPISVIIHCIIQSLLPSRIVYRDDTDSVIDFNDDN